MSPPKIRDTSIHSTILTILGQHPNQTFSNAAIIDALRHSRPNINSLSVNTQIARIRSEPIEGGRIEGGRGEIGFVPDRVHAPEKPITEKPPYRSSLHKSLDPSSVGSWVCSAIEKGINTEEALSSMFPNANRVLHGLQKRGLIEYEGPIIKVRREVPKPQENRPPYSTGVKNMQPGRVPVIGVAPSVPDYQRDEAQISKNKDVLLQRYRDFDTGDFTNWWNWWSSLRETQTPEGAAIRYMENALEGLWGEDRRFVSCYLAQILCNPNTYDSRRKTYMPRNSDFRKAAVVSDAVNRFLKDGSVPDEIYAAMQVLGPEDSRTTYIWGESFRMKRLELLRDVGMQKDPESACRVAKGRYKIFLGYDA